MKYILPVLTALFFLHFSSASNILNVPATYLTIQSAINFSVDGDTILVAPGSYTENINFRGKNIVVTSEFYLTNDPATIYNTIIDGNSPSNPDSASCVLIVNGEDSTTVLQGFYITRGAGTKWTDEHGAGLYREGGGILIQYSSPIIRHNIIADNIISNLVGVASTGGGGVRIGDSYVRFYNNIVMNNRANYGAGVVLNYTGGEIYNNIICANYGSFQFGAGSGIWLNNVFSRPLIITNNTIAGNSSTAGFCGISGSTGFASIRNNIIWGNTSPSNQQVSGALNIRYCNVQGGFTGAGNMNINPLFADTSYVLSAGSPCIDKGDSSTVYNDLADSINPTNAKYPSRGGVRNDMGAYGGPLASLLSSQVIGIPNIGNEVPKNFMVYQNYPNPFNPETNITFDLPKAGNVSVKIYDITGREVMQLFKGERNAGRHNIRLNADALSSGVYFYSVSYGGNILTNKMILTK